MDSNDIENSNDFKDNENLINPYNPPSKGMFRFLTFLSIISSFLGLFILITIITGLNSATSFSYSPGLIIGVLLLGGGIILLMSLIVIRRGSHNNKK